MKQLELFSPEELEFLEMISRLEKKNKEIDLLKLELTHLKSELEEATKEINILSDPFEDFCDTFSYDEEFDHLSTTSDDYLVERSDLTFENIKPTKRTIFH
tara:strand:- start:818 stop:1120 length:303 start_codon:yes stop_codon:yes gene_type:complete